ncbi:DUF4270 domain-containing protein [Subsaximicrobium wynnwilliamsii]|uniref:DUF4270 domain-containing protein n=1 Tax=Subsaximicrobium wynnwilliamsii TaxID=291179 RepID=A0A5C6ZEY1_9FLAO|nr:DUF4270 domain-containing protein [Subsaximicrobium wynnwilliamsii]TXD82511.1 DUF4270 domain-containing protein [Subsaximicrobium wynnwilliamsii]TXD88154.1 DUF4270 domain-containing protein [Subsaximicrobium wynnwilliamsii]TXE02169.1 DUF4270 domain-containing protein [Subsaximicrobium wynnwilliamsii]
MKTTSIASKYLFVIGLVSTCFIACERDFADLESDIINNDNASHFGTDSNKYDVIAFTKAVNPVQTNNLPINILGVYNDPNYGTTTASFVTQMRPSTFNPTFGENVEVTSVVLTIPYFSTPTEINAEGETIYRLDSLYGSGAVNLKIFENNYFLRDFKPNSTTNESQNYYSNRDTGLDMINSGQLENQLLYEIENFVPDPSQITIEEDGEDASKLAPSLRIVLPEAFWVDKIIAKQGEPELENASNFNNYFRGLYFKVEQIGNTGSMVLLNLASTNANITINYTRPAQDADADPLEFEYAINFGPNRANFLSNDFSIPNGNATTGDENLYLKGGAGSVAEINLFNGEDLDDTAGENSFEAFKKDFVETDANGKFISQTKLVNEANLIFHVNQNLVNGQEPFRLYLYDMKNNRPLVDYFFDQANSTIPRFSRPGHLGVLERVGNEPNGEGIKYRMRITEHINNLLLRDSTNVKLGIAVSTNVNLESNAMQSDVLTTDDSDLKAPISSVLSPNGTVLYGNNTTNEAKKLYLEIFYTEPNN